MISGHQLAYALGLQAPLRLMVIRVLGTAQCQNHQDLVWEEHLMPAHIQCHVWLMLLN